MSAGKESDLHEEKGRLERFVCLFGNYGIRAGRLRKGCRGNGNEGGAEESKAEEAKSVQDIYEEITQKVELCSPVTMTDSFISNYYGIDPDKLEEYVFSMSEDATSAETIIIMKVRNEADKKSISPALETVRDEKSGEMKDYLPAQFEIVDKSSVKTEGSYVYLVISERADEIIRVIRVGI